MKASKLAANQFIDKPKIIIDKMDIIIPNDSASEGWILPDGMGLSFVLSINRSMSLSNHWFRTPDAPAPRAIANIPIKAKNGLIELSNTGTAL